MNDIKPHRHFPPAFRYAGLIVLALMVFALFRNLGDGASSPASQATSISFTRSAHETDLPTPRRRASPPAALAPTFAPLPGRFTASDEAILIGQLTAAGYFDFYSYRRTGDGGAVINAMQRHHAMQPIVTIRIDSRGGATCGGCA